MKKIYEAAKEILSEKYKKEDLEKEAQRLSKLHNVPYEVTKHVINKETGKTWATDQVNPRSGATGIMQILPKYATNTPAGYEVDVKDLKDPYKSMNAGIKKLGQWYNTHRNKKLPEDQLDVVAAKKAMASYNAGPGDVVRDKKGKIVGYTGAYKYINISQNPKHLRRETQDYIADFGVDTKVASNKAPTPVKREAAVVKAQIDPKQHEIKDNRPQDNTVPAPVVQSKSAPQAPKKEVKVDRDQQQAAPEVKTQVATPNADNPYPPGSKDWYFKDARNRGLDSFVDPNTGKKIAVKLKDTSESTNKMKKIYESAKQILSEKSEAPSWGANLEKLFRGEKLDPYGGRREAERKSSKTEYERDVAAINARQEAKAEQERQAKAAKEREAQQLASRGPSKDAQKALSADRDNIKFASQQKLKKELSPFEQEFAKARAEKRKEFTWQDPNINKGRPYKVSTKLKGEDSPPPPKVETRKDAAHKKEVKVTVPNQQVNVTTKKEPKREVTTTNFNQTRGVTTKQSNVVVSPEEMNDIDNQKPAVVPSADSQTRASEKAARRAEVIDDLTKQADQPIVPAKKSDDEMKSDDLWKDIRQELENETPEEKAARDARIKQYKKEWGMPTNEEKQMSINKKFNVSDSLYTAVMEVMKKPSQGSTPRNEKEKDLAAMSPPGHLITHGDVLKARGVTMKEAKKLDPVGKEDDDVNNDGKVNNSDSYLKNRRKAIGSAIKEEDNDVTKKILDAADFVGGLFTGETARKMMEPKKEDKKEANQIKPNQKSDQPKKDKNVKEGVDVERKQVSANVLPPNTQKKDYENALLKQNRDALRDRFTGTGTARNTGDYTGVAALNSKSYEKTPGSFVTTVIKNDPSLSGNKGDVTSTRFVPSKTVKEGTMRNGKYVDDAPRPGEVPSPDEGYRGAGKPLYTPVDGKKSTKKPQPGSRTKAMDDVEEEIVQEMSSKMKMKLGLYNKKKTSVKENTDTPGNGYEHQCAIHVKSESFGEGRTITTQHADLDENGHIAWYDVMFEHGIERYVPTDELEILVSESHMHSMKKKKRVAEETGEERNARLSRENERFKAAEAGNYQGRNARGDVIRSGGEVVKGNPNPPTLAQRVAGNLGLPNKATDALGEPMYKSSRPTSGSGGGGMGGGGPGMAGSTSGSGLLRMMNPQKIY
jgi:soluble lytic murein transglycosylase-like protein